MARRIFLAYWISWKEWRNEPISTNLEIQEQINGFNSPEESTVSWKQLADSALGKIEVQKKVANRLNQSNQRRYNGYSSTKGNVRSQEASEESRVVSNDRED
jgi:hypothetical protein